MDNTETSLLQVELKHFLDEEGRLVQMPVKRKKKLAFLALMAEKFEHDRIYTEQQINEILNTWHTYGDPVTWRRELVEHGILSRDPAGSRYERTAVLPTWENLLRRYQ